MKNTSELDDLKQSVEQAKTLLEGMEGLLQSLNQSESIRLLTDAPIEDRVNTLQLALQYRMDGQDALVRLMQIEQSLLQVLGVERLASNYLNLDNLAYALGSEDFKLLLSDLNALIDKLLKIIHKHQMQHRHFLSDDKPAKEPPEAKKLQNKVKTLSFSQKKLLSHLASIQQNLNLFLQKETLGPVHNHIVALQGPVSRFFQLVLSGLKQSHSLIHQLRPETSLSERLEPILDNANETLHQMAIQSLSKNYFAPTKQPNIEEDRLEARAEKKRLGQFFYRP